ncbi:MAG: ParA family protein [Streptosporangiaceae bacterium]
MIVAVAGTKGGSGKTTTAVCLAQEAAGRGVDVLLLDLDPQGTATEWVPELSKHVPAVRNAQEVAALGADRELVLIDTPPGAAAQALAALEAADVVVAVTGLGPGDMRGLQHLLRMVEPDLIVPVRRDARRTIHAHALEALRSRWPERITDPVPMSAAIERAQADQASLPLLAPAAIAYRGIYESLIALGNRL